MFLAALQIHNNICLLYVILMAVIALQENVPFMDWTFRETKGSIVKCVNMVIMHNMC